MREGLTFMRLVRDLEGTKLAMEGLILSHKLVNIIEGSGYIPVRSSLVPNSLWLPWCDECQ